MVCLVLGFLRGLFANALWKLRMQVFNLALVDQFVVQLEHEVLEKLIQEERAPIPETAFPIGAIPDVDFCCL